MIYRLLGANIRQRRRALGLTQESLAAQVGISASFLGHIERGSRTLSVDTLLSLCRALGVTPNDLLGMPCAAAPDAMITQAQALLQSALALLREPR